MKKLITVNEVRKKQEEKCSVLCIESDTIITPAARDLASELGIQILQGCKETKSCDATAPENGTTDLEHLVKDKLQGFNISEDIVQQIVQEVIKNISECGVVAPKFQKECDPSGIRLIRGKSVVCERFDTGKPSDHVGITEILNIKESPNMATGFMEIDKTSFDWTLGYDELDYIIEGTLDITVDGKTYRGHAGDVFFIPMNTSITFSSPDHCRFFFSTYPANWQDLSN